MTDTLSVPATDRLAALLRRDAWDILVLAAETERARRIAEQRQQAHARTLQRIRQAQAESRALCRPGANISLARHAVLGLFMHQEHRVAQDQQQLAQQAEALHQQVAGQLQALRRNVKLIERHRASRQQQLAADGSRQAQQQADETWLLRLRRG